MMADNGPVNLEQLLHQARAMEESGDFDAAKKLLLGAVFADEHVASLFVWLGWLSLKSDDPAEALGYAGLVIDGGGQQCLQAMRLRLFALLAADRWHDLGAAIGDLMSVGESLAAPALREIGPTMIAALRERLMGGDAAGVVERVECIPEPVAALDPMTSIEALLMAAVARIGLAEPPAKSYRRSHARGRPGVRPPMVADARDKPLADLTILTSLMPPRHEQQRRAVASWLSQGATVLSLNASSERHRIEPLYPDVRFVDAARDASDSFGKPYVYLGDMLAELSRQSTSSVGIVNSDIVLDFAQSEDSALVRRRHEGLVFGHRFEPNAAGTAPAIYRYGYDWFLFPTSLASRLTSGPFVFGCPWWDYWLPIEAMAQRIPAWRVERPIALHEPHEINWQQSTFETLGAAAMGALEALDLRQAEPVILSSLGAANWEALRAAEAGLPLDTCLYWLSAMMRSAIAGGSAAIGKSVGTWESPVIAATSP